MKKTFPALMLGVLAGTIVLSGCDMSSYSEQVMYGIRTDPMYVKEDLKEEPLIPDPPGQFPLLSPFDLLDSRNPLYAENQKKNLFKAGIFLDPTLISIDDKKLIDDNLKVLFGTPARPTVEADDSIKEKLKLDNATLAKGSILYRVHCLHCHGVQGNGRGPTARWVNPHPRDFRPMLFKFQSVDQIAEQLPPSRGDLKRTLLYGVEGTAMPAFNLLPEADIEALVSYVMHLSMRGKVEFDAIKSGFELNDKGTELSLKEEFNLDEFIPNHFSGKVLSKWVKSQDKPIPVAPYNYSPEKFKESVMRGKDLFNGKLSKDVNCYTCHVAYGRESKFRYDGWGTLVKPQNLTQGQYRGGRRPIDIYYRIHSGINGSGMAKFGNIVQSPEQIWDLVNFVQVMGNASMRQALDIKLD